MNLKLGSIEFINSMPVDLGLLMKRVPLTAEIVTGTPARLNEMLLAGELDISPVSAIFFAEMKPLILFTPALLMSKFTSFAFAAAAFT